MRQYSVFWKAASEAGKGTLACDDLGLIPRFRTASCLLLLAGTDQCRECHREQMNFAARLRRQEKARNQSKTNIRFLSQEGLKKNVRTSAETSRKQQRKIRRLHSE